MLGGPLTYTFGLAALSTIAVPPLCSTFAIIAGVSGGATTIAGGVYLLTQPKKQKGNSLDFER